MTLFYCQNSIKFSLKSSAILHFRDSELNNFPYKVSHLQRPTRAPHFNFSPPPPQPKRASYGPGKELKTDRYSPLQGRREGGAGGGTCLGSPIREIA